MYPNALFFGITLYDLCLALGAVAALVLFRILSDKTHLSARKTNLALVGGLCGFGLGLFTATLLQAFYNYMAGEPFAIVANTGATFYGGLVGGIAAFLAIYLGAGARLLPKGEAKASLAEVSSMAACSIAAAHALGRIGCFFAGCCYGIPYDGIGAVVYHETPGNTPLGVALLPVQLIESVLLFLLFLLLTVLYFKQKQIY